MALMMGYHWPGNVRQLENVIERAFALGVNDVLSVNDLPNEIVQQSSKRTADVNCKPQR
jgi:DNA-binding NtrC family response regulator